MPDNLRPDLVYAVADSVDKMLGAGAELERRPYVIVGRYSEP